MNRRSIISMLALAIIAVIALVGIVRMPLRPHSHDSEISVSTTSQSQEEASSGSQTSQAPMLQPTVFESSTFHYKLIVPQGWTIRQHDPTWLELTSNDRQERGFIRVVQETNLASLVDVWAKQLASAGIVEQQPQLFHGNQAVMMNVHQEHGTDTYWLVERASSVIIINVPDQLLGSIDFTNE